jgi:thiol:disulfide interchange protein DsbC
MKRFIAAALSLAGIAFFTLVNVPVNSKNAYAFSANGCEGDCRKCHTLSSQDVAGMLKKMNLSHAKVLDTKLSPVKSLWEISVDDNGKKGVFYTDFSKKFIIPGPIIEVGTGSNKTAESLEKIQPKKKVDVSKIPLSEALVVGNRNAPKKVIVFTDPD